MNPLYIFYIGSVCAITAGGTIAIGVVVDHYRPNFFPSLETKVRGYFSNEK